MTYITKNIAGGDYRSATSIAVKVLILQTFFKQTLREVIIALLAVPSSKSPQHRSCRAATYIKLIQPIESSSQATSHAPISWRLGSLGFALTPPAFIFKHSSLVIHQQWLMPNDSSSNIYAKWFINNGWCQVTYSNTFMPSDTSINICHLFHWSANTNFLKNQEKSLATAARKELSHCGKKRA